MTKELSMPRLFIPRYIILITVLFQYINSKLWTLFLAVNLLFDGFANKIRYSHLASIALTGPLLAFASSPSLHHHNEMSKSRHNKTKGGGSSRLSDLVKATLLLDIVANPNYSCDDILSQLPDREYGEYNLRAIQNRFRYLKEKHKKNPSEFWSLYAAANKFAACPSPYDRDTVEEESDDEDPPSTPSATLPSTPPLLPPRTRRVCLVLLARKIPLRLLRPLPTKRCSNRWKKLKITVCEC